MSDRSPQETPPDTRRDPRDRSPTGLPTGQTLRRQTIVHIVADADRRAIITYFMESQSNVAAFSEVVDWCLREVVREESLPTRESVATELHHSQLPTLEAAGIIEYKEQRNLVRYHGDPLLEAVLSCLREEPRTRRQ